MDYRVYLFVDGHIVWARDIAAPDDRGAVEQGEGMTCGGACEIWQGKRLVKAHDKAWVRPTEASRRAR